MTTYTAGKLKYDEYEQPNMGPSDRPPPAWTLYPEEVRRIDCLISDPNNPGFNIFLNADLAKCINFWKIEKALNEKPCLYDSSVLATENSTYNGNVYLLPSTSAWSPATSIWANNWHWSEPSH